MNIHACYSRFLPRLCGEWNSPGAGVWDLRLLHCCCGCTCLLHCRICCEWWSRNRKNHHQIGLLKLIICTWSSSILWKEYLYSCNRIKCVQLFKQEKCLTFSFQKYWVAQLDVHLHTHSLYSHSCVFTLFIQVRLIVACVLAPINIVLGVYIAREFGWLEFRVVGASAALQS